jgi:ribonuclease HI
LGIGEAGTGWVLLEPGGNTTDSYTWGQGNVSNNVVEAYALWEGVCIAKDQNVAKMVVLGDFMMVVRAIIKKSQFDNNVFNGIISHILSLIEDLTTSKVCILKESLML